MASFRKILLCYDSSREGRRALLQGAELAQLLGAETHLLAIATHFIGGTMGELPSDIALRGQEKIIRDVLDEGVERLRARGLNATGHLAFGRPIEQIPVIARSLAVDLIVVGHKPCGAVARWWMGPGNAQLLDQVDCNVLVAIDRSTDVG